VNESRAARVTLFEDRAEVVRRADVQLTAGLQWVRLRGATPYIDDRSLQARVIGNDAVTVVTARVERLFHHEPAAGREAIDALEEASRQAQRVADAARGKVARGEAEEGRIRQLVEQWVAAAAHAPRWIADEARLGEWRTAWDDLDRAATTARSALAVAVAEAVRTEDERRRAEARLAEGLVRAPRYETIVEVQLDAPAAGAATVEVTYRTPCALWRPEHLARLKDGSIELITYAAAWQRTGESWDGVELVLSTARPGRAASPPLLTDDVLALRKKTDEEKKRVVVEARDQAVAVAGLDRGGRRVDEMPGVDDGGEPLSFAPAQKVSIASDGRPFRVEIARRSLPAAVARVIYPERAPVAHLRATATLPGAAPLLAGPLRVARGAGLVGRAKVDFVGGGEPFELGFGPDDGMRVRRRVDENRDTTTFTGKQVIERTVKVFLSNLSDENKRVEVIERVPVSEIEDVEVSRPTGWTFDAKDGFARREVELAPHATATLDLSYTIRAAGKVQLPF
jgi:uncharacterized protein (TIGR02231 family)